MNKKVTDRKGLHLNKLVCGECGMPIGAVQKRMAECGVVQQLNATVRMNCCGTPVCTLFSCN